MLASTALVVLVAAGVALAATISCPNRAGNLCVGTSNKDTMIGRDRVVNMRGREGGDEMRGRGAADTMLGQPGSDTILGQDGPDTLNGGPGVDTLAGGNGKDELNGAEARDALNGGAADDTYAFKINNWGNDTISDSTNSDNDPFTGNFAEFGSTDKFLTTRLTVNLTSSAVGPEVYNATRTVTVNWSNNAIDGVYVGSITDDTIDGNAAANQIVANTGADSDDTITARAGNDWISVLDSAGGDTVDCGDGTDTVYFDQGDVLTVPNDCENKNPA